MASSGARLCPVHPTPPARCAPSHVRQQPARSRSAQGPGLHQAAARLAPPLYTRDLVRSSSRRPRPRNCVTNCVDRVWPDRRVAAIFTSDDRPGGDCGSGTERTDQNGHHAQTARTIRPARAHTGGTTPGRGSVRTGAGERVQPLRRRLSAPRRRGTPWPDGERGRAHGPPPAGEPVAPKPGPWRDRLGRGTEPAPQPSPHGELRSLRPGTTLRTPHNAAGVGQPVPADMRPVRNVAPGTGTQR